MDIALSDAEWNGWKNVTGHCCIPKLIEEHISEPLLPGMRALKNALISRKKIFSLLFPFGLLEHIADSTSANVPLKNVNNASGTSNKVVSASDIEMFLAMLLSMCAGGHITQRDYLRNGDRGGLTHHKFEDIKKHLHFDEGTLFALLNHSFMEHWQAGGSAALDECMYQPLLSSSVVAAVSC